jgi:hypothetical protein
VSGITWRKGALLGVAAAPSAFAILLLEHSHELDGNPLDRLAPLAAAALILEILGPLATQRALRWAREAVQEPE